MSGGNFLEDWKPADELQIWRKIIRYGRETVVDEMTAGLMPITNNFGVDAIPPLVADLFGVINAVDPEQVVKTYGAGRRCEILFCKKPLSTYNPYRVCNSCREKWPNLCIKATVH